MPNPNVFGGPVIGIGAAANYDFTVAPLDVITSIQLTQADPHLITADPDGGAGNRTFLLPTDPSDGETFTFNNQGAAQSVLVNDAGGNIITLVPARRGTVFYDATIPGWVDGGTVTLV